MDAALPLSSTAHPLGQLPLLVKNTGKVFSHLGQDFAYKPSMVQTDAMILSTFGLVTARVMIAFGSAAKEFDPDQKALRWREAIRTSIREYGGWVASYLVLKAVRNGVEKGTNLLVGLKKTPGERIGFAKLKQDLKQQLSAFIKGKPLPLPVSSSLQALEHTSSLVFADRSPLKSLMENLSHTALFRGINPSTAVRAIHQSLPITIGSLAALGLSGFALEWFTLRHADNVAKVVVDWTHKRQTKKYNKDKHKLKTPSLSNPLLTANASITPRMNPTARQQVVSPVLLSPQAPLWLNASTTPISTGVSPYPASPFSAGPFSAIPNQGLGSVQHTPNPFAWAQG